MRKKLFIVAFILILAAAAHAAFDVSEWGARPAGMGGAFCAVSDDSNAAFFNPAGLRQVKNIEGTFMYAKPYLGLDLYAGDSAVKLGMNYLAFACPFGELGSFGLGWTDFSATQLYREDSITLSYATRVRDIMDKLEKKKKRRWRTARTGGETSDVYCGLNLKYMNHTYVMDERTLDDPVFAERQSKSRVTMDMGLMGIIDRNTSLGLTLKNVLPVDMGILEKDILPLEVRAGASRKVKKDITASCDMSYRYSRYTMQKEFNMHLGGEAWFNYRTLAARAGLNFNEICLGGTVRRLSNNFGFVMDYSFVYPFTVKSSFGTHRLSVGIQFGEAVEMEALQIIKKTATGAEKKELMKNYYNLGVSYYKEGKYAKAISQWERVLLLDKKHKASRALIEKARKALEKQE